MHSRTHLFIQVVVLYTIIVIGGVGEAAVALPSTEAAAMPVYSLTEDHGRPLREKVTGCRYEFATKKTKCSNQGGGVGGSFSSLGSESAAAHESTAAGLQAQLNGLEAEKATAIAAEDYVKAAQVKKEAERVALRLEQEGARLAEFEKKKAAAIARIAELEKVCRSTRHSCRINQPVASVC